MTTGLVGHKATYQDVLDAPEHMVAEVLAGVLHLHPRPAGPHTIAAGATFSQIHFPFHLAKGGPGGWAIAAEPELHLDHDILVPDIAGWRHSTMDHMPDDLVFFEIRPDWICEVLSPSTERIDRTIKLPIYARAGVEHAWLVDPRGHTLEVLQRENAGLSWTTIETFRDDQQVRAQPFEAIEFDLGVLWKWR
jgi:hypothetical protein